MRLRLHATIAATVFTLAACGQSLDGTDAEAARDASAIPESAVSAEASLLNAAPNPCDVLTRARASDIFAAEGNDLEGDESASPTSASCNYRAGDRASLALRVQLYSPAIFNSTTMTEDIVTLQVQSLYGRSKKVEATALGFGKAAYYFHYDTATTLVVVSGVKCTASVVNSDIPGEAVIYTQLEDSARSPDERLAALKELAKDQFEPLVQAAGSPR